MADEDIEEIADKFAGKFDVMTCSTAWDRSALAERELKISQAVCLLWQNSTTGEVAGRHSDLHLLVCVYCAGLLDLLIMEKIRINDMLSTCLCLVSKKKMVEVSFFEIQLNSMLKLVKGEFITPACRVSISLLLSSTGL